ncbi:hypothetical protein C7212DRAFT_352945 [Tuber magnatum]|uniref:Uncharacterized protein n=1 Tax=Tuber magnatum TaxID=42249 RepID=A0A317SL44_9PEZI|nr:hypothetical protein C7212DRAFT_352945 [Tuber magnatum]
MARDRVLADKSAVLGIKLCTAHKVAFYTSPAPPAEYSRAFGLSGLEPTEGPAMDGHNISSLLQNLTCSFKEACLEKGKAAGGYKVFDKHYVYTFTANNCLEAVKEYLSVDISKELKKLIAKRFLKKVTEAHEVLRGQESRMYSASLHFAYEGDGKAPETILKQEEENAKKPPKDEDYDSEYQKVKKVEEVKVIDFAHANWTLGKGPDENT